MATRPLSDLIAPQIAHFLYHFGTDSGANGCVLSAVCRAFRITKVRRHTSCFAMSMVSFVQFARFSHISLHISIGTNPNHIIVVAMCYGMHALPVDSIFSQIRPLQGMIHPIQGRAFGYCCSIHSMLNSFRFSSQHISFCWRTKELSNDVLYVLNGPPEPRICTCPPPPSPTSFRPYLDRFTSDSLFCF